MSIHAHKLSHPYAVRTVDHARPYDVAGGEPVSMHETAEDAAATIANAGKVGTWRPVAFDGLGRPRPLKGRDMMRAAQILDRARAA